MKKAVDFIKIFDVNLANELYSLGFEYLKEGKAFVFPANKKIISYLHTKFNESNSNTIVLDNKLRF